MRVFLFLIGMAAAGILGYTYEPMMRYQLTGETPALEAGDDAPPRVVIGAPVSRSTLDPATYSADQLPEKVRLKADAEIADAGSDLKMTVTAGNRVDLLRLEGRNVVISPGAGPFQGVVPIEQTDLLEQLAALPKQTAQVSPELASSVAPESIPAPEQEVAPAPEPKPVQEMPEEAAAVEPAPAPPAPAPPTGAAPAGSSDVVSIMQASVKAGDISEFTFDQVLDWQSSAEPETIDGEAYQTGVASYKAETVFGVKTIQAKALIKGGAVERWIWPKSGLEIK